MSVIQIENVSKVFGATAAVKNISFQVEPGELLVLLGTSGCGKTTTLKLINRLVEPTGGSIYVNGVSNAEIDIVDLRRSIGYIFQGIGLFPHMTVGENIQITPKLLGWSVEKREKKALDLLDMLNLPGHKYIGRNPSELSGGQKQRVGVARALAAEPKVMLMDEPFGALDPITRNELQGEYQSIVKEFNITTIFVTHDMTEALLLGDRIAVMDDGVIVQLGKPAELLNEPINDYVRTLMETPKTQIEKLEQLIDAR